MTYRNKRMEALVEGRPEVLIHNGKLFEEALQHAKMTRHELMNALREEGCSTIDDVHAALLENDGTISVIAKIKYRNRYYFPPCTESSQRYPSRS